MKILNFVLILFLLSFMEVFAKVKVITTIKPLADIFKEIGKDKVEVSYLIPPNVSFHIYEYKISDIKKVSKADIFVYIGSGEPNIEGLLKITKGKVIKIGNIIPKSMLITKFQFEENHKEEEERDHHNDNEVFHPAVWLDPRLTILIAESYYKTLVNLDSKNKEFYYRNFSNYVIKVVDVYNYWKSKFDRLDRRYFVSYHYAYPYITKAFFLNYLAVIELGHGREPTIKHILNLINLLKSYKINYIFVSKQFYNPKYVDILKRENIKPVFLDPIGENTTYIDTINNLLKTIYKTIKENN